jgi:hypothetical protein
MCGANTAALLRIRCSRVERCRVMLDNVIRRSASNSLPVTSQI